VEGKVFGMQTFYNALKQGNKGVYIASTTDPKAIREYFKEFGWDLSGFEDNFAIVDAYSALVGMVSKEKYVVSDPENIENLDEVVSAAIEEYSGGGDLRFPLDHPGFSGGGEGPGVYRKVEQIHAPLR
jgi:hypothetical protein